MFSRHIFILLQCVCKMFKETSIIHLRITSLPYIKGGLTLWVPEHSTGYCQETGTLRMGQEYFIIRDYICGPWWNLGSFASNTFLSGCHTQWGIGRTWVDWVIKETEITSVNNPVRVYLNILIVILINSIMSCIDSAEYSNIILLYILYAAYIYIWRDIYSILYIYTMMHTKLNYYKYFTSITIVKWQCLFLILCSLYNTNMIWGLNTSLCYYM